MDELKQRLTKRKKILEEQVADKERLVLYFRKKMLTKKWLPKDQKELQSLITYLSQYYKLLGKLEDTAEIVDKFLGGEKMEKYGVECQNEHKPEQKHMTKVGSEDYSCNHCGKTVKFTDVKVDDGFNLDAKTGGEKK